MSSNANDQKHPADAASMNKVMVLWLISFLVVVLFGVVTYLLGWFFQRG